MARSRSLNSFARLCGIISALCAVWLVSAAPVRAQGENCSVIVDISASMAGFVTSDRGQDFRALLSALGDHCAQHYTLGDDLEPSGDRLADLRFTDVHTRLGHSLGKWLRQSSLDDLLILTDNVSDSGQEDNDQQVFYKLMKSPQSRFVRVSVFLIRLPFAGRVYGPPGTPSAHYNQPRALALYAMQRKHVLGDLGGEAEKILRSNAVHLADLQSYPESAGAAVGYYRVSLLPFESVEPPVDMRLTGGDENVTVKDGAIDVRRSSADSDNKISLALSVQPSPQWNFAGLPLAARVNFPGDSNFGHAVAQDCNVTPAKMPGGGAAAKLNVVCDLPSPVANMSEAQQESAANTRTVREGVLEVTLSGRLRKLGLGETLARWSYDPPQGQAQLASPTLEVQGRIYRLGQLLAGMSVHDEIHPSVARIAVAQELYFFRPEPYLQALLVALLLAAAGLLLYLASKPRVIEVLGGARSIVRTIRFAGRIDADGPGGNLVHVWAFPLGFVISAERATITPFVLARSGGRVWIGRDRRSMDIRVRNNSGPRQLDRRSRR